MRINSVNSVNQNQQRGQNFGMSVKSRYPTIRNIIETKFIREKRDFTSFTELLNKIRQNQQDNPCVDIIMGVVSGDKIIIDVKTKPSSTNQRTKIIEVLTQMDKPYENMSETEAIEQMLKDANIDADKLRTYSQERDTIETV